MPRQRDAVDSPAPHLLRGRDRKHTSEQGQQQEQPLPRPGEGGADQPKGPGLQDPDSHERRRRIPAARDPGPHQHRAHHRIRPQQPLHEQCPGQALRLPPPPHHLSDHRPQDAAAPGEGEARPDRALQPGLPLCEQRPVREGERAAQEADFEPGQLGPAHPGQVLRLHRRLQRRFQARREDIARASGRRKVQDRRRVPLLR
mmetsp:Transcript_12812/g.21685  ORF Transcript_12812/g.21685 Transcript_12812/m.21685 type:complete len:201 (+) Transcript_12812:1677-2279(+)